MRSPGDSVSGEHGEGRAEGSSDVQDYREAADSIGSAAKEVRSVLGDLQQPISPRAGIREVVGEFRSLVDYIFWRGVLLALAVFLLALVYRWLVRAMPALRDRPTPPGRKG